MATVNDASPVFYPAFCFKASPTHFAWVKMAAADVHRLQRRKGFEGQNIFFYINHPIRFVSVAGLIVARTEIARRTILTLDDSSGATIDVVVLRSDGKENGGGNDVQSTPAASATASSTTSNPDPQSSSQQQASHLSTTDRTPLDISPLTAGRSVRIKGTLTTFRNTIQLHLERFELLRSTNSEMTFVDSRLRFLIEVLSQPWVLDEEEIETLRREAEENDLKVAEERRRAEKKSKRRREREERDFWVIVKRFEREERIREREARVSTEEGGGL